VPEIEAAVDNETGARTDQKRGQQGRDRTGESARGKSNGGNRRTNRDNQRRPREEGMEAVDSSQTTELQDVISEQGKPRKRPSDMKRSEPPRRRRNRGRSAEAQSATGVDSELSNLASDTAPPPGDEIVERDAPPLPVADVPRESLSVVTSLVEAAPTEQEPTHISSPVILNNANLDEGWEQVPAVDETITATAVSVEPNKGQAPSPAAEKSVDVKPVSMDGITATGRACNDPRVEARPVGVVEITTSHKILFSEAVAPPASPSNRSVPRASNDPRGPRPDAVIAHAAGQS
jgi:ribonuclease E